MKKTELIHLKIIDPMGAKITASARIDYSRAIADNNAEF